MLVAAVGKIYAIAINAYREAVRDRVLLGVLGVAAASLCVGLALAFLSVGDAMRMLVDHGLVTVSWLANAVAIFLGASFLYKEIELRTLYVILAKPVARWQFVLGKYLGIVTTVTVFVAVTSALLLFMVNLQATESPAVADAAGARLVHWLAASRGSRALVLGGAGLVFGGATAALLRAKALRAFRTAAGPAVSAVLALAFFGVAAAIASTVAPSETRYVALSGGLVIAEVCVTAAVALFFSSFSTPFVTGALSLGVFLIGRSVGLMLELRGRSVPDVVKAILRGTAFAVPNLHLFVPNRQTLANEGFGIDVARYVGDLLLHGWLYAAILLLLATHLFRKRDLM